MRIRNILLGKQIVASRAEFKRLMLTAYFSVIGMVLSVLYFALDIYNNVFYSFPAYLVLFISPIITLRLIRIKKFQWAKLTIMVGANLVVFWTALHDPIETGAFLFFIPASLGSFAIFGFDKHRAGFVLALFTSLLFLLAYFAEVPAITSSMPTEEYIRTSFLLNYFIAVTISILAVYFLMKLNDSSETQLIQKELLAYEKNAELQKINNELDRFVYSVSHDLRSPLSSILGLINLANLTDNPRETKEILAMIKGRISAQDHFIREIIDYSRNARTEITISTVQLKQQVEEAIDALKFNPNAEKINFLNEVDDAVTIPIDRIRLMVIISNLIGNAVKYHDMTKAHPFIAVRYDATVNQFSIQDNGIGMTSEQQGKIFDMFYRGSDRSTGSGLGLYITKEAVAKLKGTIEVTSAPGEGTIFTVYFPNL